MVAFGRPIIVGGLIAKDSEETLRKVPLLGDLPILGSLFRSKDETGLKREVIIVITPKPPNSTIPTKNVIAIPTMRFLDESASS